MATKFKAQCPECGNLTATTDGTVGRHLGHEWGPRGRRPCRGVGGPGRVVEVLERAPPKKPCSVCGQKFAIKAGRVVPHGYVVPRLGGGMRLSGVQGKTQCKGSSKPPAK